MPKRTDISSILIIGSGPIVIGQACEFDYSGTQACRVLRDEGYRVVLANSNPATIMTDPDFADRTYVEPLDPLVLAKIIERERPDALLPTLGGQTGLNLAMALHDRGVLAAYGVELIGATAEAIATAEDRDRFKQAMIDVEYKQMRDAAFACIRRVGVETGGSNVQFAVDPANGEMVIIEMNPRVSRSSALASKATGFPIAKIAARLAVGYTLDEIPNDITRKTPASFEPTIDYVVTKVPRWAFEKLPGTTGILGPQMQSVGEAMAIGRTFPESIQKALRSLETGRLGLNADPAEAELDAIEDDDLLAAAANATPERLFQVEALMRRGRTVDEIAAATKIDPWFVDQLSIITTEREHVQSLGMEDMH